MCMNTLRPGVTVIGKQCTSGGGAETRLLTAARVEGKKLFSILNLQHVDLNDSYKGRGVTILKNNARPWIVIDQSESSI